ncbi:MAG TPA: fumarylacetoacetase [Gemmatimonadales bacterium]|nr:fumarylacetoacetase [Gemmatimonadales bacterium]
MSLDPSHDPQRRSWVESANATGADFPLQNLPLGVFRRNGGEGNRIGVAIGDQVLDLTAIIERGMLEGSETFLAACRAPSLNALMALPAAHRGALRRQLSRILDTGGDTGAAVALVPQAAVTMQLPAQVGDYTDFYASLFHATNVGSMFRPDNPLLPNYKWVPIGYHGRASSIVPSGTPIPRPAGQSKLSDATAPTVGPTKSFDYELEIGAWIGGENSIGSPVPLSQAEDRLFGICLLNDWSARDIQAWEYQPLGPFLAKNFATSISPWIVTREALEPFRVPAFERAAGDPAPLPYLLDPADRARGGISITLEVTLSSARMRDEGHAPIRLSLGSFRQMYWTLAQMITHHASSGCNLRPGDLLGSGTVSGPEKSERGCLLELTWRGKEPIALPSGETRTFLHDGDEVVMRGWCEAPGAVRIGLGECRGVIAG